MKNQLSLRRFIFFLLSLVIAASAFFLFSFAEDDEAEATPRTFYCPECDSEAKRFPLDDRTTVDGHIYYVKDFSGREQPRACNITMISGGESFVCTNPRCGAHFAESRYIKQVTHDSCGQ